MFTVGSCKGFNKILEECDQYQQFQNPEKQVLLLVQKGERLL